MKYLGREHPLNSVGTEGSGIWISVVGVFQILATNVASIDGKYVKQVHVCCNYKFERYFY